MEYTVIRSIMHFEYATVEAESEEEAINIAKAEGEWEEDPNAAVTEQWDYVAESSVNN